MFRLDKLMNENILLQGFSSGALHGGPPFLSPPSPSTTHPGPVLQQRPSFPMIVWIGPLCCDEARQLTASGPGELLPDTVFLIHGIILSAGWQGAAPGSSVCEQGQGWEGGVGPGFAYFTQLLFQALRGLSHVPGELS